MEIFEHKHIDIYTAWLFDSIANKHADIMDNYPKPNILPREPDDVQTAKTLSDVVPLILERANYEKVYSDIAWDLLKFGTAVTGTFWDGSIDVMGDITVRLVDILNLTWQPGISNIQDSSDVFYETLVDNNKLVATYPFLAGRLGGNTSSKTEYVQDDVVDTSDKSMVVDWYYKKSVRVVLADNELTGEKLYGTKTILHYVKFVNGMLLYASENVPEYMDTGYYRHGKYPFTLRTMFPIKNSVCGFGYIDVMRNPQMYIDALDTAINKNAFIVANPRYAVKDNAGINFSDMADWSKQYVKVTTNGSIQDIIEKFPVDTIPSQVVQQRNNKIDELKETTSNRDFSQGGTAAGVTAASAIAALQEAGSKRARDTNKECHRGHCEECMMITELQQQFYTNPRTFRVEKENGQYEFVQYEADQDRQPIYDIKVSAEKKSPFSRVAQNELAKEMYGLGWFDPNNTLPSLAAIDMMEFEGKELIKEKLQQNSAIMQQMQRMQQVIFKVDQMLPGVAVEAGLVSPEQQMQMQAQTKSPDKSDEIKTDNTMAAKARVQAATQAAPR